jgi:hypothetical protein
MLAQPFPILCAPDVLAIARRASAFLPADLPVATQGLYGTEGGSFCLRVHARITRRAVLPCIHCMGHGQAGVYTSWGMKQ